MDIEEKVLNLIKAQENGILQNELWKKAKIDRRKCSRIIDKLEKEVQISRELESNKGSRTYRIKYLDKKEIIKDFQLLLVGDMFNPCTGCTLECNPERCMLLSEWIYCLTDEY